MKEQKKFNVIFYNRVEGDKPIVSFMEELNVKLRRKAIDSLSVLEEYGNELREPYSKSMGKGLFELRVTFGNDTIRIFYFFQTDFNIVVTSGYVKKTERTPQRELSRARKYMKDYLRRDIHG